MPFQIVKSNRRLPPVDVLVRFKTEGSVSPRRAPDTHEPANNSPPDIRVLPSSKEGTPNRLLYSIREAAALEDVAACYRDIFGRIQQHGWTSVAVPLCPSRLPSQEVYRIACTEIRRTLAERDMQIVLIVDSVKTPQPGVALLQVVKEYIGRHFTGPETTHALTPKAKRARSQESSPGSAMV